MDVTSDVTSSDFSDEVPSSARAQASVNLFQYGQWFDPGPHLRAMRRPAVGGDPRGYPNSHVGFGHGPHFCVGANLAGLEIDVMLKAVLDRWHDIEATGEPTYTRTNRLSGLRTLPVAFTDAGRVYA